MMRKRKLERLTDRWMVTLVRANCFEPPAMKTRLYSKHVCIPPRILL